MPDITPRQNRLLAALPDKNYLRLLPKLERFELKFAENIYETGDVIEHVYFLETGIISLLSAVEGRSLLEVGIVGSEGFIGLPVFLGVKISNNRALVQGAGYALRMKTADFLEECDRDSALTKILQSFTHSLFVQISQSAACNRFHSIESRLARWLLMTGDRMKSDEFQITQDFLSNMLGVRREAVNKAAKNFQQQNLIVYNRGNLTILDRANLESNACACYEIIRKDNETFLN